MILAAVSVLGGPRESELTDPLTIVWTRSIRESWVGATNAPIPVVLIVTRSFA